MKEKKRIKERKKKEGRTTETSSGEEIAKGQGHGQRRYCSLIFQEKILHDRWRKGILQLGFPRKILHDRWRKGIRTAAWSWFAHENHSLPLGESYPSSPLDEGPLDENDDGGRCSFHESYEARSRAVAARFSDSCSSSLFLLALFTNYDAGLQGSDVWKEKSIVNSKHEDRDQTICTWCNYNTNDVYMCMFKQKAIAAGL